MFQLYILYVIPTFKENPRILVEIIIRHKDVNLKLRFHQSATCV
jgi:hypothetical protein